MKQMIGIISLLCAFAFSLSAQVVRDEVPLYHSASQQYFQIIEGSTDSANTLGMTITKNISYNNQIVTLYPDSIKLSYQTSADSTVNVKIVAKQQTRKGVGYANTFVDSIYSASAAVTQGLIKLDGTSMYSRASIGNFGLSLRAYKNGGAKANAAVLADATKIYLTMYLYYHLP